MYVYVYIIIKYYVYIYIWSWYTIYSLYIRYIYMCNFPYAPPGPAVSFGEGWPSEKTRRRDEMGGRTGGWWRWKTLGEIDGKVSEIMGKWYRRFWNWWLKYVEIIGKYVQQTMVYDTKKKVSMVYDSYQLWMDSRDPVEISRSSKTMAPKMIKIYVKFTVKMMLIHICSLYMLINMVIHMVIYGNIWYNYMVNNMLIYGIIYGDMLIYVN